MRFVVDADSFLYKAASVCETRSIVALHRETGFSKTFANRTELFGTKNNPGYIKDINTWLESQETNLALGKDDFDIEDRQEAQSKKYAFGVFRNMIDGALAAAGYDELQDTYTLYLGKGDTFRQKKATILEYKGNRKDVIKPILLKDVFKFAVKEFNTIIVKGIEADDQVNIEGYEGYLKWSESGDDADKVIILSIDKDAKAGPHWLFNPDKDKKPRLIEGLGQLFLNEKDEVDGEGLLWSLYQIMSGDQTDNYKANSATETKWGSKRAYKLLVDCTTEKEAWEAVVSGYKFLYPEPSVVTGWRGDEIKINWLYMLQENYALATMLQDAKKKNLKVTDILERLGVKID